MEFLRLAPTLADIAKNSKKVGLIPSDSQIEEFHHHHLADTRTMYFGGRPDCGGVPMETGYIRITSVQMKKFIFERGKAGAPLSS